MGRMRSKRKKMVWEEGENESGRETWEGWGLREMRRRGRVREGGMARKVEINGVEDSVGPGGG